MTRAGVTLLVFCLVVARGLTQGVAAPQAPVTVIRGGTLIDGNGGAPVRDATIVIEGNRIHAVVGGNPVATPAGAHVIDASGKFIVPGLWDTHTHYRAWFPELLMTNGVTSVLGYAGGPWINAIAEGTRKRKVYGPRMFLSQGYIGGSYMIEDPAMSAAGRFSNREQAIAAVRERIEQGASIIKVYTSTTADQLRVVADQAHAHGMKVSGHIGFSAREAALAGIDNLAHATGLPVPDLLKPADLDKVADMRNFDTGRLRVVFPAITKPWDHARDMWGPNPDLTEYPLWIEDPRRIMAFGLMDRALAQETIALLVKEAVFIESCLGYTFRYVNDHVEEWRQEDQRLMSNPDLPYIPERYRMNILDYSLMERFRPDELALMQKGYRNFQWFTKAFVDAGGKVTTGMDTTSAYHATMVPGLSVAREMQLLVDAGLTPMQAIQAATKWAAELLSQSEELGTIEAGKLADLLILRRDPLQDIKAMRDIDVVMQDGDVMQTGYHFDYANPFAEPAEYQMNYADWPVSEIPTYIQSVVPGSIVEGSGPTTITVKGRNFVTSSVVQFDDRVLLKTELVSPTELRAIVPEELLRHVGTHRIRVVHRAPGWGTTNTAFLIVKFK